MSKRNLGRIARTVRGSVMNAITSLRDLPKLTASAIDDKALRAVNVLERKKLISPRQAKRAKIGIETQQLQNRPVQFKGDISRILDRHINDVPASQLNDVYNRQLRREFRVVQPGERTPFSVRSEKQRFRHDRDAFSQRAAKTELRNRKENGGGIRQRYFSDWVVTDSPHFYDPPDELEPEMVFTTARDIRNNPRYLGRDNWVVLKPKSVRATKPDASRMIAREKARLKESAYTQRALRGPVTPLSVKAEQSALKLAEKYRTARNIALKAGIGTAAVGTALGVYMAQKAKQSKP